MGKYFLPKKNLNLENKPRVIKWNKLLENATLMNLKNIMLSEKKAHKRVFLHGRELHEEYNMIYHVKSIYLREKVLEQKKKSMVKKSEQ